MDRLEELQKQKRAIEAQIDEECRRLVATAPANEGPIWSTLTDDQKQHCCFMAFDPDNPDVPLD